MMKICIGHVPKILDSNDMSVHLCMIQIGSLCMSVVEHELKRHRSLADDVAKRKKEGSSLFS